MSIQSSEENILESQVALDRAGWDETLARWISAVGSPPLVATVGIALIANAGPMSPAWGWAIAYAVLAVLVPILYIVWLFWRGSVTDLDLYVREQRIGPLLVTLAATTLAWVILYAGAAPRLLTFFAGVTGLQLGLVLGITLRWKISMHVTTLAGLAGLVWAIWGSAAIPFIFSVLVLAWARVRLHCHTPAQTIAGAFLGSSLFTTAFLIYGG